MSEALLQTPDDARPTGRSAWTLVAISMTVCIFIAIASGTHIGLVVVTLPIIVALIFQSPRTMLTVLPVWMVMLGLVRRLTPGGGNITFSGDPVLLIGPVIILLLFGIVVSRGGLQNRTRFANWVGVLSIIAFLEAFNPKQHSLLTGLGGLLFILVPMLAFWIGRELLDESMALLIIRVIAILALLSAIYGLIQQFHGLPAWDKQWIATKGYAALSLGNNVIRAFGTFSSAEEYAAFLTVGLVAWLALARKSTRMFTPLHVAATATVATALWFESERTAVFLAALAVGVMAAARMRLRPWGVLAGGTLAIAGLIVLGGHFGSAGSGTSGALSNHVLRGVQNPLSSGSSLPGHIRATRIGMLQAFKDPIGHGTGTVTIASSRYGKSGSVGTEYDPGNMGIAFGILGLLAYFAIAWHAIKTAYKAAVLTSDVVALFGLGLLMATMFQWTNGDLYSVCWLIWLFLGYLDMRLLRVRQAAETEAVPVLVAAASAWRSPGEARRDRHGAETEEAPVLVAAPAWRSPGTARRDRFGT